jgi:hypothetical protein
METVHAKFLAEWGSYTDIFPAGWLSIFCQSMSKERQAAIFDRLPRSSAPIVTLTRDYAMGHRIPLHFHDRAQLVFAARGGNDRIDWR